MTDEERRKVEARNETVRENLGLVSKVAARLAGGRSACVPRAERDYDDLYQCGVLGLIHAIETYGPHVRCKWSTFAGYRIRAAMFRGECFTKRGIRIPWHAVQEILDARKVARTLAETLGHQPGPDEVADAMGLHKKARPRVLGLLMMEAAGWDDFGVPDAASPQVEEDTTGAEVGKMLGALPPRYRAVVEARYGLDGKPPRSIDHVAAEKGLSFERVKQIMGKSFPLLKEAAGVAA